MSDEAGADAEPKLGDVVRVPVRAVASGGAGVCELPDGRVAFVHRTAPGDVARVRITALKKRWGRGELVEVVEPGPGRRSAPCPHYDRCGGCTLEHLEYGRQLEWKGRLVSGALERIGHLDDVQPPEVLPSPEEFRYRNRVSFHLRRHRGGGVTAGFRALEDPGTVVDVDGTCLLPEPRLGVVWDRLRAEWGPDAKYLPPGGTLRLTLRAVDGGAILLVEPEEPPSQAPEPGAPGPVGLVERIEGLRAVWWRRDPGRSPVLLAGSSDTGERWRGRRVPVGPTAFLQVNRRVAESLHDAVLEELDLDGAAGRRYVDAYCGIGLYGRALAGEGAEVVGIELDAGAAAAARDGAPDGFTVLEGRVEDRIAEILPVDAAVLNPPRTGLHESLPSLLRESGPPRIVYASCDPPTLARDLKRLSGAYRLAGLRAFDLFPQTAHVETVATLERREHPA